MVVTYRNNRLVPALIITVCLWMSYWLIDPGVNNWHGVVPALKSTFGQDHDRATHTQHTQQTQPWGAAATPTTRPATPESPVASASSTSTITEPQLPPTSDSSKAQTAPQHGSSGDGDLTPSDVLLIVKTGTTSLWKRLLIHLTTSLSPERIPLANTVIYSDHAETIGSFAVVDALANITEATKNLPDFDVYHRNPEYAGHNVYVEASGVEGDNYGPPGGWIIDKYKFLPLMQHAGANWPDAKWYVYMEDDAYLFLPSILNYLSSGFDWRKPHYLGSYAAKSDVVFAHGGAGFALSRGAWEQAFGQNPALSDEFEAYTADHCCGDQVLGLALNKHGVRFGENDGDEKFTWGFNPIVHWRFGFEKWNWCSRLMSWHKVHSRDVARYYEFERSWDFSKPLLNRDFFLAMIAPDLKDRAEWWDNLSGLFQVTSGNKASPPAPEKTEQYDAALWKEAWASVDACEAACRGWTDCVQWSYVEDLCAMDDKMIMGQGYAPAMSERKTALKRTSGWLKDRLERWQCD